MEGKIQELESKITTLTQVVDNLQLEVADLKAENSNLSIVLSQHASSPNH